jgi:hypothetical protein
MGPIGDGIRQDTDLYQGALMKRRTRTVIVLVAVVPMLAAGVVFGDAQRRPVSPTYPTAAPNSASQCLHGSDESGKQAGRRREALIAARALNTLQMRQKATTGAFLDQAASLVQLELARMVDGNGGEIAPGWEFHLLTTGDSYLFSVKDAKDPCRFAFFSDNTGLIYTTRPIS